MQPTTVNSRRRTTGGFSLVELLTVIAIIVLLIGILVPAVNHARKIAKDTVSKALIGTLSTAIETFRADQQVGGSYPPSASDHKITGRLTYMVVDPRSMPSGGTSPLPNMEISGAGLLVWALAGADLQGTTGFRTFRNDSRFWAEDSGIAYELDQDTRQPLRARVGPLVDLAKVEVTRWNPNARTRAGRGSFEIPAELEAAESLGSRPPRREYPMFLDAFGGPVLYWRADPAGVQIADESPDAVDPESRGRYHFLDNGGLLEEDASTKQDALLLRPVDKRHHVFWADLGTDLYDPEFKQPGFPGYIRNRDVTTRVAPHNQDSYLLVTAGQDGIYGTGDDIANFEHNGAELSEPQ